MTARFELCASQSMMLKSSILGPMKGQATKLFLALGESLACVRDDRHFDLSCELDKLNFIFTINTFRTENFSVNLYLRVFAFVNQRRGRILRCDRNRRSHCV